MICATCAAAADAQLAGSAHCLATGGTGSGCDCQHRTDRYRPLPADGALPTVLTVQVGPVPRADVLRAVRSATRAGRAALDTVPANSRSLR